jgi:hypothetical protein
MSHSDEVKYVWAVEWNTRFAPQDRDKRGMVFYDVTLLPGVTEEEFEKFLAEEGFQAVGGILTRAGLGIEQQYLLRYTETEGPDLLNMIQKEGVAEKLKSLCKHTKDKNLYVVMGPGTASGE